MTDGTPGDGPENFANAPRSFAEARAFKTDDARHWSTRDMLIAVLRAIDAGEIAPIGGVMVVELADPEGGTKTAYWRAGMDMLTSLGMLTRAQWLMNEPN